MDHTSLPLTHTQLYTDALFWAAELHQLQQRKGKPVPYISHLIAVSSLVWEDGGDEEQAIAALLHDAIEDAGISAAQIEARFGERVAQIVVDCTDTNGVLQVGGEKEPWLLRKTRYIEHLQTAHPDSLLVSVANKAHNARDMLLDARRNPAMWNKFNAGLEGSTWYMLRLQQILSQRIGGSRSLLLLAESVQEILSSETYRACVPHGIAPAVWAAGYSLRQTVG